jgi:hypothetical protein
MVSLHDLRSPGVAMEWHEAVAVAAALASILVDAQASGADASCPHPEDAALLATGTLQVTGPRQIGATPAQGVALVLGQFLESTPCPEELRELVERFENDAAEPMDDGAAAILARLTFFERPGRTEVLAALAARAAGSLDQAALDDGLEALTQRTRLAAAEPPPRRLGDLLTGAPPPPDGAGPAPARDGWASAPPARRWLLPAGFALLAFVVTASLASWWLAPAPDPAVGERVEEDLPIEGAGPPGARPGVGSGGEASARRGGNPPESARSLDTPPAGAPATATRRPTAAAPAADNRVPAARPPAGSGASRATRDVEIVVAERDGKVVARAPAVSAAAAGGRVFTAADARVTPAILIRPHLPAQPPAGVPEEQIGTLEFVVGESGAVEHVRLISPANRFHERMLVAAAKTWQFQPATRDGRPVRYRTRIRVTL